MSKVFEHSLEMEQLVEEQEETGLQEGRNVNISNEDYHADRSYISSSGLKLILQDEKEYHKKYIQGIKDDSKDFFDFGTYIHALILEPHTVDQEFAFFKGAVKRGKLYDEFIKKNNNKIIISKKEVESGEKIMEAFNKSKLAKSMIKDGIAEDTYCAEIDGVKVKVRTDYLKDDCIVDVKTTSKGVNKQTLEATCVKYDYDLSAALYMDVTNLFRLDHGMNILNEFYFLFINKKDSDIVVAKASREMISNGRRKYMAAIKKYKKLKKGGFFDKIELDELIIDLDVPSYGRFE